MRKLLILVPAAILALLMVDWFGPSQSAPDIYTVPAAPLTSTQTPVATSALCDLAPEASGYVSDCLSVLALPKGDSLVKECNDLDMQGQNDYQFQKQLNAEGWNLGECYKAMLG